jgi:Ca2+-binding RTX toxin-like protein
MATYEEYARMSAYVYGGSGRPLLPSGWTPVLRGDGRPVELSGDSGYYGAIFRNSSTGEYVLASRGTEITDAGDRRAVVELATSKVPRAQLDDAERLIDLAIEAGVARDQLTYTGHSLGGSIGQLQATRDMRPAVTFNASPVKALLPELGRDPNAQYPIVDVVDPSDIVPHSGAHLGTRIELARPLFPLSAEIAVLGGASPFGLVYGAFRLQRAHSIDNVVTKLGTARSLIPCPVVLDLDGDGVETTSVQQTTFFDHNADGFAERTGWVGRDDGLLVRDRNGNGSIDSGRELFGNHTLRTTGVEAAHGYEALADLDSNADGKVDSGDAAFGQLRVWRDADENGISAPGELQTLGSLGIRSVSVSFSESSATDAQENALRQVSTFTRADGSQGVTTDVWFRSAPADTIAAAWLPVPTAIAALPDSPGSGTLPDLSQAIVRDQSGVLEGLVRSFVAQTSPDLRMGTLEQILFHWSGSAALDPSSRGPVMDARQLAVLEAFSGEPFVGGWGPNPAEPARPLLLEAYNEVRELVYAELMTQSHLKPLYERITFQWDPITQVIQGDLSDVAGDLEARLAADPAAGRTLLSEFARSVRAFDREDTWGYNEFRDGFRALAPDLPWLMDAAGKSLVSGTSASDSITGSGAAEAIQGRGGDDTLHGGLNADLIYGDDGADTLTGDDGDDHVVGGADADQIYGGPGEDRLEGGDGNDEVNGEAGNDTLFGGEGDDRLFGNDGDDVLHSGRGADTLDGGRGNDVYTVGRNAGQATIKDNDWAFPSTDTLRMEAGIASGDVLVVRDGSDLVLRISNSAAEVRLYWWFVEGFGYEYQVQRVEFSDGSVWTVDTLKEMVTRPTEGPDSITGFGSDDVLRGQGGDDTLSGAPGNDRLEGGGGNDALYGDGGDDTLVGGAGDDRLDGGLDNDTYVFGRGSGHDTIHDNDWWRPATDRILFEAGVAPGDVTGARDGHDLVLRIAKSSDQLRLHQWFLEGFGHTFQVQEARFANGTVWNLAALQQLVLQGTPGPDVLNGYDSADSLNGFGGNDVLYGGAGNDRLDGGAGADAMHGGVGDDTYVVDVAADVVVEAASAGTDSVLSSISYALPEHVEKLSLTGTAAINGTGNGLANLLGGNSGANRLDGGGSADRMTGGAGNDTYVVESPGDLVIETSGQGTDSVLSAVTHTLGANVENLTLTGTAAVNGTGNTLNNVLVGNGANNRLSGGTGADTMVGNAGNDTYVVDRTGDVVTELPGQGIDTIEAAVNWVLGANVENLVLTGTSAVAATGNDLANSLTGNASSNLLSGGGGADLLAGGASADHYLFGRGGGADRIVENDATLYARDLLSFEWGIQPLEMILSRSGNDLLLALRSSDDSVTIQDWYRGPSFQVEQVQAGGRGLAASQVDVLIQAMATYSSEAGLTWAQAIAERPAEVEAVLAAHWQMLTPTT